MIRMVYLVIGVSTTKNVTKAIDKSYGFVKSVYWDHIVKLADYRVINKSEKKNRWPTVILFLIFDSGL